MAMLASKEAVSDQDEGEQPRTRMSVFVHPSTDEDPEFTWARHYYKGKENREGVRPWLGKKLFPGSDPRFGCAAKVDVLLPVSAPGELGRSGTLVDRYDETHPPYEKHVMVHVKIMLNEDEPWHVGFERVRSFARAHFADRFATILIAHVPAMGGLTGKGSHVHCAVLARTLSINGFAGACTTLCSDQGFEAALSAWRDHKVSWDATT